MWEISIWTAHSKTASKAVTSPIPVDNEGRPITQCRRSTADLNSRSYSMAWLSESCRGHPRIECLCSGEPRPASSRECHFDASNRNLVSSLLEHQVIKTTLPKAKETAREAEKVRLCYLDRDTHSSIAHSTDNHTGQEW